LIRTSPSHHHNPENPVTNLSSFNEFITADKNPRQSQNVTVKPKGEIKRRGGTSSSQVTKTPKKKGNSPGDGVRMGDGKSMGTKGKVRMKKERGIEKKK